MAEAGQSIMRRKLSATKAEAALGGPGADRAWRIAMARAARDTMHITLDFKSLVVDKRSLAEIVELVPARSLIAVLDGPSEALGMIAIDPSIMAGFIEAQTIGKVKSTEITPRKATRTDAAMVAAVIDAALRGMEQALADEADLVWAGGFRYASFLDDARPLGLLLEDAPFKVLRGEVDLASGARVGEVMLALPADGRGLAPAIKAEQSAQPETGPAFTVAFAERVNGSLARIDAVLARLTLPLSEVMNLVEGAVLPLPQAALDQISLEGFDGRRVAEGKLGQNRGMRAVRLADAAKPADGMEGLPDLGGMGGGMGDLGAMGSGLGDLGGMGDFGNGMGDLGGDLGAGFPAMNMDDMFKATGTD